MYHLNDIESTVQQTAEAIAAALKIEVEIADADLIRVAGTGKYKNRLGSPMNNGFVYRHVMKTGESVIIDNPGHNELCQPCPSRGNCLEYAEVAIPIRADDQIIGVIGLVSFNEEQTKRLMDNKESLLLFLGKMAELLVGKVVENQQNHESVLLSNQLLTVLDLLHDGILLINAQQQVTHYNTVAAKLMDIDALQEVVLYQLLDDKRLWSAVERGEAFSGPIQGKRVATQLYCDAVPIKNNGVIEGAVISVKDIKQIKKLVKEATISEIETHLSQIIGDSPKMKALKAMALHVAPSKATLLIQGESGTGKELLARAIHQSSKRKGHTFIAINCGAIPENLLESELFGYEEGSFTGARRGGKLGKFEIAHNGTIFLDEIGDMPLHLQVKILRVLQERRVERVGGTRSIPIDVRIIAATHRDLDAMVKTGEFREDLYYRLNVIPIMIPPLRDRLEDVPILVHYYLDYYSTVTDRSVSGITQETIDIMANYPWPGNVRELGNVVEYCVTMVAGGEITAVTLPQRIKMAHNPEAQNSSLNLKMLEREAIMKALTVVDREGHKDDAAKLLGISRATLYRKIKDYKIGETKTFS